MDRMKKALFLGLAIFCIGFVRKGMGYNHDELKQAISEKNMGNFKELLKEDPFFKFMRAMEYFLDLDEQTAKKDLKLYKECAIERIKQVNDFKILEGFLIFIRREFELKEFSIQHRDDFTFGQRDELKQFYDDFKKFILLECEKRICELQNTANQSTEEESNEGSLWQKIQDGWNYVTRNFRKSYVPLVY